MTQTKFTEEEKEVLKRLHAHRTQREKEMVGMTNAEKAAYMNKLGYEALVRSGLLRTHPEWAKAN
jgi:hypothetical protein